jgi:RES domain-containing protein
VFRADAELVAFRLVRRGYPAFEGSGAARWGGRWSRPGRVIIHAAETYSLAVLESLVHFNIGELPPHLEMIQIKVPAGVSREVLEADALPGWDGAQPNPISQDFGDRWYDERRSCVLIVPSKLSPFERNILLNGQNRELRGVEVGAPQPVRLDDRLRQRLNPGPRPQS